MPLNATRVLPPKPPADQCRAIKPGERGTVRVKVITPITPKRLVMGLNGRLVTKRGLKKQRYRRNLRLRREQLAA